MNDGLCNECAKLDLEGCFTRAYDLYEGARRGRNTRPLAVFRSDNGPPYLGHFYHVTTLGNRLSRKTACKLCNFLRQMTTDPGKGTYKLLAICSSESYLFETPKKNSRGRPEKRPWGEVGHNVFMAVVPIVPLIPKTGAPLRWFETELPRCGSIYRMTQQDDLRLILPREVRPMANFRLVRKWLDICHATHRHCAPRKPTGASLPGFRAINCIKTPPEVEERSWPERYVALSYVWAPPSGDWQQTILDAIEVTKQLNETFLWVDRLFIDQSNLLEKQFLVSKMDAIYEGAEFTIVAASGDARSGLPGVTSTPQVPQPRVDLKKHIQATAGTLEDSLTAPTQDPYLKLIGITTEEYEETTKHREWLDLHRFEIGNQLQLDMSELMKDEEIMDTYSISKKHLDIFHRFAEDDGCSIDKMMTKMAELARRMGVPLQGLLPRLGGTTEDISLEPEPITSSAKVEKPLPSGRNAETTRLVSIFEDPRITIKESEWATRGWTYQEGVLSNRRLVFTEKQLYWECHGMTANESMFIDTRNLRDHFGARMADYVLSGIFDGDLHRVPELQYGFKPTSDVEVSQQVLKLDSHIRAFTSRNLSYDSDSLNAFLGVAARYSADNSLYLLFGIPVWVGLFANEKPGLQDTFALSVSTWTHTADRVAEGAEMYVVECPRRVQFPSWTWAGWKGMAEFSGATADEDEEEASGWDGTMRFDFFKAMTSPEWVSSINRLWSAEMKLHTADGSEVTMLMGRPPVPRAVNPGQKWLLTILEPRVLRHMYLMHSTVDGEWRRLMGKAVRLHLSVSMTEAELTAGHKAGELVTVPVFAGTVPFIWNGTAHYLILRRVDVAGRRWERIGRLVMMLDEGDMDDRFMEKLLVKQFGREIVLI